MCFMPSGSSIPKGPADPNAAADAAAAAEVERRRLAQGYGSTIVGGGNQTKQPTVARKMLFGQ